MKTKSLNKILNKMRNSTLLLGEFLWGSPYRLDILTIILKKIFNQIFFRVFRVFRGLLSSEFRRIFWVAYG